MVQHKQIYPVARAHTSTWCLGLVVLWMKSRWAHLSSIRIRIETNSLSISISIYLFLSISTMSTRYIKINTFFKRHLKVLSSLKVFIAIRHFSRLALSWLYSNLNEIFERLTRKQWHILYYSTLTLWEAYEWRRTRECEMNWSLFHSVIDSEILYALHRL